ncbi:MAG: DNA polymerase III subunit delta' [Rhodospirillales bacterium]|nr:DNA polymerase III subunit delta' [Rhodospirillales bacterium]
MSALAAPQPVESLSPRAAVALVGQGAAERALLAAWESGRLPHAWLITGPHGIGKATLAYRFARFILAGGGANDGLFGAGPLQSLALPAQHPVFRRVAAGGHPDLFTLEPGMIHPDTGKPTQEIVVAQVRQTIDAMRLTPVEGGWRIVVIDAAENMNPSAANALLKILEEPPPNALLLLVSHAPGRLLATIRSRCRFLALPPLADADVAALLGQARPELDDADRAALIRLAEGSIGRAIDLTDRGGVELYRELIGLLARLPALDVPAVHDFADDHLARGADATAGLRTAFELLAGWVARIVRHAATGQPVPAIVAGEGELIARLAAHGGDRWLPVWERLGRLPGAAEGLNLDRKLVLLDALLAVAEAAEG